MSVFVLDTSALITLQQRENGSAEVERVLHMASRKKSRVMVSFISLTELFYIYWQREGKECAYRLHLKVQILPIEFIYPNEKMLLTAGEIKATHSLSLADALVAALAKETRATLVHKDPEFESLSGLIQHKPLPYKKS